jgi:hypothetical protein
MMNLQTPGVYLREIAVPQPPLLQMSITGFVGQAERGPLNYPQRIENLGQFRDIFGDFVGYSYLPYSIFGYFLNGGQRCYIVRVAHETARPALLQKSAAPLIGCEAINEGSWGNSASIQIDGQSSRDIPLAELEQPISQKATKAIFRSVAGLARGDAVTLLHPRDPVREQFIVAGIDPATRSVTFNHAVSSQFGFPAHSGVIGRGFRLIFRFRPSGKLVREEVFDNLSMNPDLPNYFVQVINGEPEEKDYSVRIKNGNSILARVKDLNRLSPVVDSRPATLPEQSLEGGYEDPGKVTNRYLSGYEEQSEQYFRPVPPGADDVQRRAAQQRFNGLAGFELVNEIGLIAIPDLIVPDLYENIPAPQRPKAGIIFASKAAATLNASQLGNFKKGQQQMLKHCGRMADRFAILDSPRGAETGKGVNQIQDWPADYQFLALARYGALYYPWIKEKAADFKGFDLTLPPSGHLAGIFGRTETGADVGRAPANEVLRGVIELEMCLSDAEQALLNPRGVNCLRSFPGRGLMVWGARTLSQESNWRYVNVVRLTLAVIKQILINLQWTVFEPNDRRLWDKIVATLTIFLRDLFQRGALVGERPEEAFFVKCDDETNPPAVIDRGEVVTRLGIAPARPAEFVVVTIKRTSESVSVSEGLASRR